MKRETKDGLIAKAADELVEYPEGEVRDRARQILLELTQSKDLLAHLSLETIANLVIMELTTRVLSCEESLRLPQFAAEIEDAAKFSLAMHAAIEHGDKEIEADLKSGEIPRRRRRNSVPNNSIQDDIEGLLRSLMDSRRRPGDRRVRPEDMN